MSIPASRQDAKRLVESIRKSHGSIGRDALRGLKGSQRREIEDALTAKDSIIGSSLITLTKNLYSSKARFVFELLQNADDNKYTKAAAINDDPCASFHVYPHKIIFECNEDGFTDDNLRALCSVGASSKAGTEGYIGEKGIGFKSVFMVASKVYIQSGALSFSFEHRHGGSGMGMISPRWKDMNDHLQRPGTKMTLYLRTTGDADVLAAIHESIRAQFAELNGTFLLFMKNLRRVQVSVYDNNRKRISFTTYSITCLETNYPVVKCTVLANRTTRESLTKFFVAKRTATNLAKNENRTYLQADLETGAYSESEIKLAFPLLSETPAPNTDDSTQGGTQNPQSDVFVYLPLRHVGFHFLIQADFVTNANREDIVEGSQRNNGLFDGIAATFLDAVTEFVKHHALKYQWVRYLPDREKRWGKSWSAVADRIAGHLAGASVLFDQNELGLSSVDKLFRLRKHSLDENGDPLFSDGKSKIISSKYGDDNLNRLSQYGLHYPGYDDIVDMLRKDLQQGALSRMRSPETSDDWHMRVAKLLNSMFTSKESCIGEVLKRLKKLNLCPLEDGTWVSAFSSSIPVYFPRVNQIEIPPELPLRIISRDIVDSERLKLLGNLGVKKASIKLVRNEILRLYHDQVDPPSLKISNYHLKFLFSTENVAGACELSYNALLLYDQLGNVFRPFEQHMCITANILCTSVDSLKAGHEQCPTNNTSKRHVRFVNEEYFKDTPNTLKRKVLIDWFYNNLGVKRGAPELDITPEVIILSSQEGSQQSTACAPKNGTASTAPSDQYLRILYKVIDMAQRCKLPIFPGSQPPSNSPHYNGSVVDLSLGLESQIQRDCKVGAAGELYVFELLTQILPDISIQNWQSNNRKYVTVHPKYADMGPWRGCEIADIMYRDDEYVLTNKLIEGGYLPRDIGEGAQLEYLIEVKATLLGRNTPFYMSDAQYRRMRDIDTRPLRGRKRIYVIFRVYNLGREDMDLDIYPNTLWGRLSKRLNFTPSTWSVLPTRAKRKHSQLSGGDNRRQLRSDKRVKLGQGSTSLDDNTAPLSIPG
ncbi:putative ino80 chromatin remodeling complex protein [Rosellinia necatrix]|uniref:Putative ino80 chromatin remodeling complex protein n=1 Tax=Rosellinia necatrix TaxID=77044 RepID=A0A1W2TL26_ROSNE|nr:putative ino80 chromatin remodeling complex protein [Rosellinia necatrix]